jgi:hypothetical protein
MEMLINNIFSGPPVPPGERKIIFSNETFITMRNNINNKNGI